ncbi:MAG TPA: hypothetical protein VFU86_07060 [Terriglobales bacterium]|nr:hypothetical protein [Terriglobales bacterium]
MRHLWKWMACCAMVVLAATALASAQESLGDVARQERAKPKPQAAKVVTNDDLPSAKNEDVDDEASADSEEKKSDTDKDGTDKKAKSKKDGPLTADERIKQIEMWKSKIAAQESKVQGLDQQVQQIDRDYRLRMSAYYADLGMRLRDEGHWADEEKKYHEQIAIKQKERDAERDKLEDMKDEARRAGINGID